MTLRPFRAPAGDPLDVEDYFIEDDWSDYKLADRDNPTSHDHLSPETGAGERHRGMFRPEYRVTSGSVVAENVFQNGRLRYAPNAEPGRHEVAVHCPITVGSWTVNFRFEESTSTGQYWYGNLMHDPATGEAIQVRGDEDHDLRLTKIYADGSTDDILTGIWQWSWNGMAVFAEVKIHRNLAGRWEISIDKVQKTFTGFDPWLPSNPTELRLGTVGKPDGENTVEKQSSYVHVNADRPFKSDY